MRMRLSVLLTGFMAASLCLAAAGVRTATPQTAVEELLAADRAFAAASARTDTVAGLSAAFADDIIMMAPREGFVRGKSRATAALRANPDNTNSRIEWTPIRGGVSADGLHGFTFGFMTLRKSDNTQVGIKYLAYWVKTTDGWRVAALKRRVRPAGAAALEPMKPAVPARMMPPTTDAAKLAAAKASLEEAERAFSDEAQVIGIGPAFAKYGREDAVHMGGPGDAGFVVGAAAIGRAVSGGEAPSPSPVSWSADSSLVASSGDLGITFGMIQQNTPVEGRGPVAFFTIWWRPGPAEPWRYIAE